ncbi:hypothetical protein B9Z19DRAFT_1190354 [Tuber borchii]|uniref:Uncharacterized protein n=1 Tax=Tuber borchii TaxID=42251 RepID=A0A2T7A411_TUBBO|nr:hypothetical protein B9Z19DRAFT_1190354 [Tuber borchii]
MAYVKPLLKSGYQWTKALVNTHTGQFISGTFTMAAALCVITDSRTGRNQARKNIALSFREVHKDIADVQMAVEANSKAVRNNSKEIENVQNAVNDNHQQTGMKIDRIEGTLHDVFDDLYNLGKEVDDSHSMIVQTAHHTMKALSGDKKPMKEWYEKLEKSCESGPKDRPSRAIDP